MKNGFLSWRHLLHAVWTRPAAPARTGTGRVSRRLRLERLEPRLAPAAHDTLATALPLTFDAGQHAQVGGTLANANQVDLYALSLNAGDEAAADVSATNAANLVDCLRMFDSSGRQLAFAEDTGDGDSSQTFEAPLPGLYYVGVSSGGDVSYDPNTSASGSGGLTTGSYTLTLTRSSLLVAESPSNDTLATAQTISGNTILQGTYVPGSTAYYAFTATETGGLIVSVTPADATAFLPRLTLYGASGQLLIQSDAVGSGNAAAQLSQHLQPGDYYLAVSAGPTTRSSTGNQGYLLDASFAAAQPPFQPLSAGSAPNAVAVGDFNHDGNLDLVTANPGAFDQSTNTFLPDQVSVLLGRGDGTFQASTFTVAATTGGASTGFVAVGDFNRDGNLDLAIAVDDAVSVLLGRGDGTFLPAAASLAEFSNSLAVGDFNGDGNLDLVNVTGPLDGPGTVAVFSGLGDGTFQSAGTFNVGLQPLSVAVGDFNHDGKLDLVTANNGFDMSRGTYDPGTVSVLLGRGDGTFLPAATYTVGDAPRSVAIGDFNHDGNLDLAVTGANTVSVLLGQGDGTFLPAIYALGTNGGLVAVGDFNHDGNLDLAITGLDRVAVLLGHGDGTFMPAVIYAVASTPTAVAVGDFNHAGNLDLAITEGVSVGVLPGRGDGTFLSAAIYAVGLFPYAIGVGDFNHDGNLDLVTANNGDSTVSVMLGRSDGTFLPATTYAVGNGPLAVAVGDFNHDGSLDLATANSLDYTVSVLLGRGDGTFLPPVAYIVGAYPDSMAVGDFNNDGNPDLVTTNEDSRTMSVLLGRGDGTFQASTSTVVATTGALAVGDFNHDGNLDLAFAGYSASVLLGRGDGTFLPAAPYTGGNGPSVAIGDFNHDGNLDLVTAGEGEVLSVLLGRGDGTFQPVANYPVEGDYDDSVAVGDFNHDGNPDLLVANYEDNTVLVLLGNSDGTFQPATSYAVGTYPTSVAVGDFNHDGNLDLVSANLRDNTVSVLLNQGNGQFQASTPTNGIAIRNVPCLQDLDSDGIPDSLILNSAGNLLFRHGFPGNANQFAPPEIINPSQAARADAIFRTATGWAVAAVDEAGNTVSIYSWDAVADSFQRTGSFATGNYPVRIAAVDLNGDGLDDLVVANDFDNSVTLAFQQRDGTFSTVTRTVGVGPSDIKFANLGGQDGLDIVVSDQVSGDFTVLFNDDSHAFLQQSRYRAGAGLFDINVDPNTGAETILSQLQTVGVVAGDFTGSGRDDLVVVNRGANSFTLLPNQGQGIFTDPQPSNAYFTSNQASQAVSLTLPGDTLPSVAILMEDLGQIWIYRNQGDGTFAAPIKIDAGNEPTGFSVATVEGKLALLVGNAYGDILTLLYDGDAAFAPDRANLQDAPLAVGTVASTGQQYAVVADQNLDQVSVYYRKPGSDQFDSPVPVNSQTQPLLAPGAVQLFTVPGDPNPYLVVANSLSNNVLVYHGNGAGGFDAPSPYSVGFDPVSVTVADLNGDGIPDLAVANEGSNDVSILIGAQDAITGAWTATAYQRLVSGGSGPLAVAVENTGGPNGPNLLVTNSDGKVVLLPGIGSSGVGSGFFQDTNPQTIDLGSAIVRSAFDAATGQLFVVRADGGLSILNGDQFTSVFFGQGVTALDAVGPLIVAGFADGSVGLLSGSGALLGSEATGFTDELSALQVLQDGDVYVTERGAEEPVIVSFASVAVVPELLPTEPVAEATGPAGLELFVIATLVPGGLAEAAPAAPPEIIPAEDAFTLFAPTVPGEPAAPVAGLVGETAGPAVLPPAAAAPPQGGRAAELLVGGPLEEVADAAALVQTAGWDGDTLGATEALRARMESQRAKDRLEDVLDLFLEGMDQLQRLLRRTDGQPATPGARPQSTVPMRSSAIVPDPGPSALVECWFPCDELMPPQPDGQNLRESGAVPELGLAQAQSCFADAPVSVSASLVAAVFALELLPLRELADRRTFRRSQLDWHGLFSPEAIDTALRKASA